MRLGAYSGAQRKRMPTFTCMVHGSFSKVKFAQPAINERTAQGDSGSKRRACPEHPHELVVKHLMVDEVKMINESL